MKAELLKVGAEVHLSIIPKDGSTFTLEELQAVVGGYVQLVWLPKREVYMVLNEDGAVNGLPTNQLATAVWLDEFPMEDFPIGNTGHVFGDVLLAEKESVT